MVGVFSATSPQAPGIKPGMISPMPLSIQMATKNIIQANVSHLKFFLNSSCFGGLWIVGIGHALYQRHAGGAQPCIYNDVMIFWKFSGSVAPSVL